MWPKTHAKWFAARSVAYKARSWGEIGLPNHCMLFLTNTWTTSQRTLRPRCKARQAPPLVDMCAPNCMRLDAASQSGFRQCRAEAEAVEYYNLIDPFTFMTRLRLQESQMDARGASSSPGPRAVPARSGWEWAWVLGPSGAFSPSWPLRAGTARGPIQSLMQS